MRRRKKKNKVGATPGKLALVAVLGVVLVTVVVSQLPENPSAAAASRDGSRKARRKSFRTRGKRNAVAAGQSQVQAGPVKPVQWPALTMQKVLEHDPFVIPAWVAEEREVEAAVDSATEVVNDEQLEQYQQQGTSLVVISGQDKVATIGDQQYRVGDFIEGYPIIDITTQGIILAEPQSR